MSRKKAVVAATALAALLVGAFLFAAWFAAFDGGGVRRGDLAYYVFIPAAVRHLSTPEACAAPVYASRTNDSLEAEVVSMEFPTHSTRDDLHAAYAEELEAMGCESEEPPAGDDVLAFRCSEPKVTLTLRTGAPDAATGCRPATLEFRF